MTNTTSSNSLAMICRPTATMTQQIAVDSPKKYPGLFVYLHTFDDERNIVPTLIMNDFNKDWRSGKEPGVGRHTVVNLLHIVLL